MLISKKLRLIPTKAQETWLKMNAGTARFVYNHALGLKKETYEKSGITLGQKELMRDITDLKYTDEYLWLKDFNSETIKYAVKDMLSAYDNFFKNGAGYPKFKKKFKCKESFYVRYDRIYSVDDKHVKFPNLKEPIKISEPFLIEKGKVKNPRVSFDNKYWYLSITYETDDIDRSTTSGNIGIDRGIKNLAVCSDGTVYGNINKDEFVIKLEERKRRLQRKISRAYEKNKQGSKYVKTKNIIKMEKKLRLICRKLSNIRKTYIHQVTSKIVKTKPSCIVIEDLDISDMMKNKYLAKHIQDELWYFFEQCLTYKVARYENIELKIAPRHFASTKKCNCCGNVKKFISLEERIYKCDNCGYVIDRDLNAAYNLRDLT